MYSDFDNNLKQIIRLGTRLQPMAIGFCWSYIKRQVFHWFRIKEYFGDYDNAHPHNL